MLTKELGGNGGGRNDIAQGSFNKAVSADEIKKLIEAQCN